MTASLTLRPTLYEELVPGGGHTSFVLKRGQLLRITDIEGGANVSLLLRQQEMGLELQLFVKNLFDDDVVINYDVGSEQLGLTRGVQLLEPRLYGVSVTKRW